MSARCMKNEVEDFLFGEPLGAVIVYSYPVMGVNSHHLIMNPDIARLVTKGSSAFGFWRVKGSAA